jgi:geranylgeranyl pyrophosphate synthase
MASRKLQVIGVVAAAAGAAGMVGGQALDRAASRAPQASALDADSLRAMHARKTGALIRAAAAAGAILGGAGDAGVARVDEAAAELGLAFQIVDDVLDVEGAAATLGKTPGKDAAAGKPTYPALFGLDGARQQAAACVERAEALLRDAGIGGSRLADIGRWIVDRRH